MHLIAPGPLFLCPLCKCSRLAVSPSCVLLFLLSKSGTHISTMRTLHWAGGGEGVEAPAVCRHPRLRLTGEVTGRKAIRFSWRKHMIRQRFPKCHQFGTSSVSVPWGQCQLRRFSGYPRADGAGDPREGAWSLWLEQVPSASESSLRRVLWWPGFLILPNANHPSP